MINLLHFLIFGQWLAPKCQHKWAEYGLLEITRRESYTGYERDKGVIYICKCEKCGILKKFDFTVI